MTLHATRDGHAVTIHGNTGVNVLVENSHISYARITENAQHIRYFHEQLGHLLDEADAERKTAEEATSNA